MTSEIARLAELTRSTLDAVHGEAATLKPMDRAKGPHGVRVPSQDRSEATITAIFYRDVERAARNRAQPTIGQTRDRMINRSPEIYCSTGHAGDIAIGDRLLRRGTDELFEIVERDRDGLGDVVLALAEIRNA